MCVCKTLLRIPLLLLLLPSLLSLSPLSLLSLSSLSPLPISLSLPSISLLSLLFLSSLSPLPLSFLSLSSPALLSLSLLSLFPLSLSSFSPLPLSISLLLTLQTDRVCGHGRSVWDDPSEYGHGKNFYFHCLLLPSLLLVFSSPRFGPNFYKQTLNAAKSGEETARVLWKSLSIGTLFPL